MSVWRVRKKTQKLLALLVIFVVVIMCAPWKPITEWQIKRELHAIGITEIDFSVSKIGLSGVVLSDIVYDSYQLDNLTLDFTLAEIISGNFNRLHVNSLMIALGNIQINLNDVQTLWSMNAQGPGRGATWSIDTLVAKNTPVEIPPLNAKGTLSLLPHELLVKGSITSADAAHSIDFTLSYPFEQDVDAVFSITDASLHVMGDTTIKGLRLVFDPMLIAQGLISSLHAESLSYKKGKTGIHITDFASDWGIGAAQSFKNGHYAIGGISIEHPSVKIPKLSAAGDITLTDVQYVLSGDVHDVSKRYYLAFGIISPTDDVNATKVTLRKASYPWESGVVTLGDTRFALFGDSVIPLSVGFKKIPLEPLLSLAIADKVKASGVVSGSIPLRVYRDGNIQFGSGTIAAIEKGIIHLAEDAIPGNQEQINLVRDVMKNFHYSKLSIDVSGDVKNPNSLSLLLSLRGKNPDVYNGRDIHLNVRLNGDVLSLVTQSMTIFNDPQSFLTQE